MKSDLVALRIHSPVEIFPLSLHFDISLIDSPRIVSWFQVRSASLVQFRCIALHPSIHSCMIYRETTLQHHLLQIAVAERVAQVPPDPEQDDIGLEVTPNEMLA
jgi:hypothetical protein